VTVEHLFSAWQEVVTRIRAAEHVVLLSDFDGTLTPIVSRPDLAYLSERTRSLLRKVVQHQKYTVGIISGRALDDLKDRVGLTNVLYAGNYGLEVEAPGFELVNPDADKARPLLDKLYQELHLGLDNVKGVIIENKGLTLSVHYRLVEDTQIDTVRSTFERITLTSLASGAIEVTPGKKVYEIKPAISWHKGKVIDLLLTESMRLGHSGATLPFFLGDDVSDEAGFHTVDKYGGVSIFIGEEWNQSHASYHLRSPDEVEEFLDRLP